MSTQDERGEFYRQLFEEVSDAIFVYDPGTGVVVDANPAAAQLTGYAVETLIGNPVTQFSTGTPEEVERAATQIIDRATEDNQHFEWAIERADGDERTTDVSLHRTVIDGADRVVAIMRDVTERERAQADLAESQQRLSLLTQRSPDVFWMFSADWEECLFVNEAYETVWGRSADALRNDPSDFLAGVHPEDRETVQTAMEQLSNGSRIDLEYRVNEGEDFQRWVWVEGIPIAEDGELTRSVGFARDITDQKKLEKRLREQNERLSALTDNVPVILFELDSEGVFVQSTGRGLDTLDREPGQVVGKSIFDVYGENEPIISACREALEGRSVKRTVELAGAMFDAWYEPKVDDDGTVDGVIGVAVNITERHQIQEELRANEQALRDLHTRASRTDLPLSERIRALLDIGRERLDLPFGFLTRISDGTQHVIEALGTHEDLQSGASAPLSEAYCRKTIEQEGLLGVQNAPAEGWTEDPAYERFQLNCYLGGKIIVDDELYGTVCFASSDVRDREFSPSERAFVELLVQWLGYELEREQYEEELRTVNEELESVLETSPLAIVELDEDAVVRRWNPAAEEMFGLSAEEAIGSENPIIPESKRDDFEQLFERVFGGEQIIDFETVRQRPSGSEIEVSLNIAPITTSVGETARAVAVISDVTARKRRQRRIEALREATQRLVGTQTETEVGTIAVETAKEALGFPVCAMWLHDESKDVLRPIAETEEAIELVGPAPTIERGEGLFWQALATGRSQRYTDLSEQEDVLNSRTKIRSETIIPVGNHGVLTVSADENNAFGEGDVQVLETLAGALDAALNSVESQQLLQERERELKRQNKQLEEFADVIAHDIRGPLTAARGFFEIALETNEDEHFEQVENAHERMERMIDDLLTLASQGKSIGDRESVDIGELARSVWPQVEGDASLEIEGQFPELSGDASRLEEVLMNLFRNAVEHAGPDVTVRVGSLDGEGFYVEDDGSGIPPEKHPHIFDFGYTTDPRGTGLGLAIVKEIIEAHGWMISVTNGSDGGARFEIRSGNWSG